MSQNLKITNLFKEKKKSNKRCRVKNADGIDIEDQKFKEFDSHLFKSKKVKFQYPKQKIRKTLKTLSDIKQTEEPEESDSKSTQAFSKKYENLIIPLEENDEREDVLMKEEKLSQKSENIFELSSRTKHILNQVMNKKKEAKQNKISNKENDCTLFENSKITANNKIKNNLTLDSLLANLKKNDPPKLSLKTMEIMQKLNEGRKNRFSRPASTIKNVKNDSSFSTLKFKYEELLTRPRELRLPVKYKILFNIFLSLEQIISLNKIREKNQMNTFDNIRNNVENVCHHSFNMKILQQILYVVPHFYIMKYSEKKNKSTFNINDCLNRDYDLLVDIPKDFNERISKNYPIDFNFLSINYYDINSDEFCPIYKPLSINESHKRKEIFKNILNRIVNIYHDKYLKSKNIKIKFDPLKEKTWEHTFDPDEHCDDIPLFEIPLPPNKSCVFQDIIQKNDIKNEIMKDALSMINKSEEEKQNDIKQKNISVSCKKNKYVSQKFLEKIKMKEKANNIINEINNYSLYYNSNKDMNAIYREILIQMKTILIVNKKSMELNKISEAVLNSSQMIKDTFVEKNKMAEIITLLCGKYGDCVSIKNHSVYGRIVVLEKSNFTIPNNIILEN